MCSQGVAAQRHRHGYPMEFYSPKPLCVRSRLRSLVVARPRRATCPNPRSPHTLGSEREMPGETVSFIPASGWMVARASPTPATRAGPASACNPSRSRMNTPPPPQVRAVPWCWNPGGLELVASGRGRFLLTQHAKNTSSSSNFMLRAKLHKIDRREKSPGPLDGS
ncbi:hypothetical protein TcG_07486 [Trypanosoma cruzi]|nr:hypothetical protein TcG_07486 [Trypanosoma cruzi]